MGSAPPISVNSSSSSSCAPVCTSSRHQQHTQELQRISSHSFGGMVASGISSTRCSCSRGRCAELLLRAACCHRHTKASTTVRNGDKCKVYCGRAAAQTDGTWCRRLPLQLAVAGMGAMLQGLASPVLTSAAHTGMPVSPSMSTYGI